MTEPRLSALVVRVAAAIEIEALTLPSPDRMGASAQQALLKFVQGLADSLRAAPAPTLGTQVGSIIQTLSSYPLRGSGDAQNVMALESARGRLIERLEKMQRCLEGGACTCGSSKPGGARCLSEFENAVSRIESSVRELYGRYEQLPAAPVVFKTEAIDGDLMDGLYPEIHVNGYTNIELHQDQAVVGLRFKDGLVDWRTLAQVPYALSHELVCHAFHGLRADRRENTDQRCCWSEGWMDALAWMLTQQWLLDDAVMPPWVALDRMSIQDACSELHARRYRTPQPGSVDRHAVMRRSNARKAFDRLRKALGDERRPVLGVGSRRVAEFSIRLNLCATSPATKDRIIDLLTIGLLRDDVNPHDRETGASADSSHFNRVVVACTKFCDHEDPDQLVADLEEAVNDVIH